MNNKEIAWKTDKLRIIQKFNKKLYFIIQFKKILIIYNIHKFIDNMAILTIRYLKYLNDTAPQRI